MTEHRWSFDEFVQQLRTECEVLERQGASVELEVRSDKRSSARLRAEQGSWLGELTAWDDGAAHVAVLDLRSGDFVFEQDGISLADESSEVALTEFFSLLRPRDATSA